MTASSPPAKTDYVAVLIAYASFIVLGIPGAMLGIAWKSEEWPSIQRTFGLDVDAVAALFLATTIGYSFASVIGGRLFGRFNSSTLFIGGALLSSLAYLAYAFMPSWWLIVFCGLFAGFGSGVLDSGMNIYFAAVFNARLMNWLHASFGLGTVAGIAIIQGVLNRSGGTWQTGYVIAAGAYFAIVMLFLVTRSRWVNVGRGTQEAGTYAGVSPRATLRLPLVWIGLVIFISYAALEGVGTSWTFPLFNVGRGVDAVTAGLILGALQTSFTVGRVFFGIVLPYFKPTTLIRACGAALIATTALLIINPFGSTVLFEIFGAKILMGTLVIAVYGFFLAPIWAVVVVYLQEQLGPLHGANAIGFMVAAAGIGIGVFPGITGTLAKLTSFEVVPVILLLLSIVMAGVYELAVSSRLKSRLVPATT